MIYILILLSITLTLSNLSIPRAWLTSSTNSKYYLFAGGEIKNGVTNNVDIYNSINKNWFTSKLSLGRHDLCSVTCQDKIYFAGGWNDSTAIGTVDNIDIFISDQDGYKWDYEQKLSVSRGSLSGACLNDYDLVFFAGGQSGETNSTYHDTIDILNIKTQQWSTSKLSIPRADMSSISINDRYVLFAGGDYTADGDVTTNVDIYDGLTNKWSVTNLSVGRNWMVSAKLAWYALFAGGSLKGGAPSDIIDVYDVVKNNWFQFKLSVARTYLAAAYTPTQAFFAGGLDANGNDVDIVDVLDITTKQMTVLKLSQPKHALTGAFYSLGSEIPTVIFAGGEHNGTLYDSIDMFQSPQ